MEEPKEHDHDGEEPDKARKRHRRVKSREIRNAKYCKITVCIQGNYDGCERSGVKSVVEVDDGIFKGVYYKGSSDGGCKEKRKATGRMGNTHMVFATRSCIELYCFFKQPVLLYTQTGPIRPYA